MSSVHRTPRSRSVPVRVGLAVVLAMLANAASMVGVGSYCRTGEVQTHGPPVPDIAETIINPPSTAAHTVGRDSVESQDTQTGVFVRFSTLPG